jgi:hypothetical protein
MKELLYDSLTWIFILFISIGGLRPPGGEAPLLTYLYLIILIIKYDHICFDKYYFIDLFINYRAKLLNNNMYIML